MHKNGKVNDEWVWKYRTCVHIEAIGRLGLVEWDLQENKGKIMIINCSQKIFCKYLSQHYTQNLFYIPCTCSFLGWYHIMRFLVLLARLCDVMERW